MSSLPPPLPSPSSASGLLVGGSPAQLAMRAQAVLPSFPPLSPAVSASSSSPSSSPPLSSTPSDVHITHVHLSAGVLLASSSSPSLSARRELSSSSISLSSSSWSAPPQSADERCSASSTTAASSEYASSKAHKAAICTLLEALQTTMFTKKKEALDAYQSYVSSQRPRFTRADALLLLYGSPVTPNSTLSSFHSTAAFSRIDRGLLAASGQLSWKNHQLRASAAKALGVVALLLDGRHNADAAVFHQLLAECDYPVIRLMKLPKHLSAPSPASSAQGNLTAALKVIDIVKDIRPDLIDALLEERDAHSSHHRPPANSGASQGPRSAPPTLHINIQANSAVGTPRSSPAHDPAPPSPRSPHSPPPLPISISEALHMQPTSPHGSTPSRPPPPLPTALTSQHQPPPPPPPQPPALPHHAWSSATHSCQSPHSSAALPSPWLTSLDSSPSSGHATAVGSSLGAITQPLSACSSPLAGKKKHFGSLPAGLHRLHTPLTQSGSTQPGSTGGVSAVGDDWKQRLRSHLSGFFAHRVSREELERSGVLKRSQVFGVPLDSLPSPDDAELDCLPPVLRRCLDVLSAAEVMSLAGLFRISGDSREINDMKVKLDVGEAVDLHVASPHSVAGLLKMWLRELPEPLLTFDLYAPIVATVRVMQQQQQQQGHILDALHALLDQLPAAHQRTLDALLAFLHRVSACSAVNLMTATNLAICFSPNILRPRIETLESVARDSPVAIAAISALIGHSSTRPHTASPTPLQPVSPTSPASPTSASGSSRSVPPPLPSPLPSSPRSKSLPAVVTAGTEHCSPGSSRSPPPLPHITTATFGKSILPTMVTGLLADKHAEECKFDDGQTPAESD